MPAEMEASGNAFVVSRKAVVARAAVLLVAASVAVLFPRPPRPTYVTTAMGEGEGIVERRTRFYRFGVPFASFEYRMYDWYAYKGAARVDATREQIRSASVELRSTLAKRRYCGFGVTRMDVEFRSMELEQLARDPTAAIHYIDYPAGAASVVGCVALVLGVHGSRRWYRSAISSYRCRRGRCIKCGYDLRGSARSLRCPECGQGLS